MTDRELLEKAAKAAGLVLLQVPTANQLDADWWAYAATAKPDTAKPWNPLTDDGDALRLAVKLSLNLYLSDSGYVQIEADDVITEEFGRGNPYAATRRAIVRAAAALAGD